MTPHLGQFDRALSIMALPKSREYDLVLFGATGYTGKLCAEHIALKLPTTLKWAIAGRSSAKLAAIADELRSMNPDRLQPGGCVLPHSCGLD